MVAMAPKEVRLWPVIFDIPVPNDGCRSRWVSGIVKHFSSMRNSLSNTLQKLLLRPSRTLLTMFKLTACIAAVALLVGRASSFSLSMTASDNKVVDRRSFGVGAAATIVAATTVVPMPALADYDDFVTTESGLKYKVTKEGSGSVPNAGMTVQAHYTGWLDDFDSVKKFDSSRDRGRPFSFKVGAGQVIRGWDEGEYRGCLFILLVDETMESFLTH